MTQTEKRLRKAGLGRYIDDKSINVRCTRSLEVAIVDFVQTDGSPVYDREKTSNLVDKICNALDTKAHQWGGHQCGDGWWWLEKDYDSAPFEAVLRDQLGAAYY